MDMVAHSKHRKLSPRKENHNSHYPHKAHTGRLAQIPSARPPVKEEEEPKDDEEPRPEDLAKEEEALKAAELEEAAATTAEADADGSAEHRGRERTSYDGDTAIK